MQMQQMVDHFADVGVIEARPGPSDRKFPAVLLVESLGKSFSQAIPKSGAMATPRGVSDPKQQALSKAGWESAEQLESFRNIRFRRTIQK